MSKLILLTQGHHAIVDDADYDRLSQWKWHSVIRRGGVYAARNTSIQRKRTLIYMHCAILEPPAGMKGDHINGNTLDNRRINLRTATHAQNMWNRRPTAKPHSSRYKGVSFNKRRNKWTAQIRCENHTIYLGYFTDELQAALAYDQAARRLHGEFARTNFPATQDSV